MMTINEVFNGSRFWFSNWSRERKAWASSVFYSHGYNTASNWIIKTIKNANNDRDRIEKIENIDLNKLYTYLVQEKIITEDEKNYLLKL